MTVLLLTVWLAGHQPPKPVSCWTLLPYVWIYGEDAAVRWALRHGYSPRQIEEAQMRCRKV